MRKGVVRMLPFIAQDDHRIMRVIQSFVDVQVMYASKFYRGRGASQAEKNLLRLLLLPLVILAGMGLSVEAGLLGPLGVQVGHLWATLSIFGVGSAILYLLLLFSGPQKGPALSELPRWQLIGGFLGPMYVVVLTLATPHIGIAMTMIAILSGQVGKSVLIDHFGWFGTARKRVNGERWIALALIVVALVLIARG